MQVVLGLRVGPFTGLGEAGVVQKLGDFAVRVLVGELDVYQLAVGDFDGDGLPSGEIIARVRDNRIFGVVGGPDFLEQFRAKVDLDTAGFLAPEVGFVAADIDVVLRKVREIVDVDDAFVRGADGAEETVGVDQAVEAEAGGDLLRVVVGKLDLAFVWNRKDGLLAKF